MAENQTTNPPDPSQPTAIPFVAADPRTAPRGYGSGTVYATVDHRVCALVLHPVGQPELRLLLNADGTEALAAQLTAVLAKLRGEHGHA